MGVGEGLVALQSLLTIKNCHNFQSNEPFLKFQPQLFLHEVINYTWLTSSYTMLLILLLA